MTFMIFSHIKLITKNLHFRCKVATTEDYVMYAKWYYRNAPYDWIKAILKFHTKNYDVVGQENGLKSKTPLKISVSTGNNRGGEVCSRRGLNLPTGEKSTNNSPILTMLILQRRLNLLIKPLFFFF